MSDEIPGHPKRVLQPMDRIPEVLCGLIMAVTFTGSLSIAQAGRASVREMLIAAIGCNVAWGIIDAILYLMGRLAREHESLTLYRAVRRAAGPEAVRRLVADALPPALEFVLQPAELESIHRRFLQLPEPPESARLYGDDWRGALGIFSLVVLATFPVVIPFFFMQDARPALRASDAIAVLMLFLTGFAYGRVSGGRPWLAGLLMAVLGSGLVVLTIALHG